MRLSEPVFVGGTVAAAAGAGTGVGVFAHASASNELTFAGVIIVALVGVFFTKRRQLEALQAEAGRQTEALEAEERRLERQLNHERELADLAEIRELCDELLSLTFRAVNGFIETRAKHRHKSVGGEASAELLGNAKDLIKKMGSLETRFTVRALDPIASAAGKFRNAFVTASQSLAHAIDAKAPFPEDSSEFEALAKAHREVTIAIRKSAQSRLPTSPGSDEG